MTLQEKALSHIIKTLNSIETYKVYRAIDRKCDELKLEEVQKKQILSAYGEQMDEISYYLKEAREWVQSLKETN